MSEAMPVAQSGDEVEPTATAGPSFDEFVSARSPALWRTAYLLTGDSHKAEDLLQTALTKAWLKWNGLRQTGSAEAYVRKALVTTYTDWWRRRWNGEVPTQLLPERASISGTDGPDRVAVRRDVLVALAALPRGQRAVVVLRYYDDLSEAQTAEALGVSPGTVKSQASRALKSLRASPALTSHEPLGDRHDR